MIWTWILIAVNFLYGLPLWRWRYEFRSAVYNDTSWKINFRPWFIWETHALFSNKYFDNKKEIKLANKYRLYLSGQILLLIALWQVAKRGL